MLSLALLEDEIVHQKSFHDALQNFEKEYADKFDLVIFDSSSEILKSNLEYDIIFIDIGLKDNEDGITIGQKLRDAGCKSLFIIISSYTNRHKDAINIGVIRYIEKPFKQANFNEALLCAVKHLQTQRYVISITFNGQTKLIHTLDIIYIENYRKKRIIHLDNGITHETTSTWQYIVNALPSHMFCFIQKGILINFHHLTELTANTITLPKGDVIRISRNRKDKFREAYVRYVEKQMWESHYLL